MLPKPFATSGDQSAAPQVREMTGDLRLARLQSLDKVADAHFAIAHEIEQPQAGTVGQGAEQRFEIELGFCHFGLPRLLY